MITKQKMAPYPTEPQRGSRVWAASVISLPAWGRNKTMLSTVPAPGNAQKWCHGKGGGGGGGAWGGRAEARGEVGAPLGEEGSAGHLPT